MDKLTAALFKYWRSRRSCNIFGSRACQRNLFYMGRNHCLGSLLFPGCHQGSFDKHYRVWNFRRIHGLVHRYSTHQYSANSSSWFSSHGGYYSSDCSRGYVSCGKYSTTCDNTCQRIGLFVNVCLSAANARQIESRCSAEHFFEQPFACDIYLHRCRYFFWSVVSAIECKANQVNRIHTNKLCEVGNAVLPTLPLSYAASARILPAMHIQIINFQEVLCRFSA